ncbi:M1 family metallopeptidase [Thauera terpenica]|nr:M1 family aminopeptidase [Thauera terpenica]
MNEVSRSARALMQMLLAVLALAVLRPALASEWPIALDVVLDPASRSLQVEAELRPTERDFRFVLHAELRIASAEVDGKALRVESVGGRGEVRAWRIRLPAEGVLRMRYGGTLPALDAGLDHREVLQGMPPMAAQGGTFLSAGSAWYPRPAEVFSYRVDVRVPGGQRVVVPGRLVAEHLPGEEGAAAGVAGLRPDTPTSAPGMLARDYRARFEFDHAADGIDLMAGPWIVREHRVERVGAEPLRLRTYFPPALDAEPGLAEAYLHDSARYIARYSARIGAYPFTEFSVVASPLPTGFGMPTLTYLGEQVLRLPFIRATSLGHEVLHNWWGNGVLVDYARGNWSEGLTTFMADYAYKEEQSDVAAREMRLGWLRDFAALPMDGQQALAAFRSRTHGAAAAVGYGKAAMVFVMLRDLIGEAAFDRGIKLFWEQNRFRIAGWKELQLAFEQASGRVLADFFRQWLDVAGGPKVALEQAYFVAQGNGGGVLHVELSQSGPTHTLHLPLQMEDGSGSQTRWLNVSKARETIRLTLERAPQTLSLDPELRVWRRLDEAQLPPILRQWMLESAPQVVIADEGDAALAQAGKSLATRFFERPPRVVSRAALSSARDPVLLVGTHAAIDVTLAHAGLPPRPASLGARGTAQVWTLREGARSVAVVSARDPAALAALERPLPHYGGQSWLLAEGSRVFERGVWDAQGAAVAVEMR